MSIFSAKNLWSLPNQSTNKSIKRQKEQDNDKKIIWQTHKRTNKFQRSSQEFLTTFDSNLIKLDRKTTHWAANYQESSSTTQSTILKEWINASSWTNSLVGNNINSTWTAIILNMIQRSQRLKLDPNPSKDIWTYKHTTVRLKNKQNTMKLNRYKLLKRHQNSKRKTQPLSS